MMSQESTKAAAAVADKVAHSVDYMEQYTADLVAAVRKGAGGVGKLPNFVQNILQNNDAFVGSFVVVHSHERNLLSSCYHLICRATIGRLSHSRGRRKWSRRLLCSKEASHSNITIEYYSHD